MTGESGGTAGGGQPLLRVEVQENRRIYWQEWGVVRENWALNESDIAIVGLAGRFPGAPTLDAYEVLLSRGTVAHQDVPRQRWDHRLVHSVDRSSPNRTPARMGGFIDDFTKFAPDYFGLSPKRARIMDPQQRLVLETTRQALDDAGYRQKHLGAGRTGVYIGVSSSDHRNILSAPVNLPQSLAGRTGQGMSLSQEEVDRLTQAIPGFSGYSIVGQQLNMNAANVSNFFDFRGPSFAVDTACSSGLVALHEAAGHLRSGQVDAAVVGGVYVQLDPSMMVCFSRIGALSRSDRCQPFSNQADGFVMGEGVGVVILKRLVDAVRDKDPIAAVILGTAVNNDGQGGGAFTPQLRGQMEVLGSAWRDACRDPADVDFVEAHGTATPVGDDVELEALGRHFCRKQGRAPVALGAVKANIGHAVSAAGMASLFKGVLSLRGNCLFGEPGDAAERPRVSDEGFSMESGTRDWPGPRLVGINAFGFGGTNAHVVMESAPSGRHPTRRKEQLVWLFSAPDEACLRAYLQSCFESLQRRTAWTARGVMAALERRERHPVECRIQGGDEAELLAALAARCEGGELDGNRPIVSGDCDVWLPPVRLPEVNYWAVDETKQDALTRENDAEVTDFSIQETRTEMAWAALIEVTESERSELGVDRMLKQDLGFDSLLALEFEAALGKRLSEHLDLEPFWTERDRSIGELIEFVADATETASAGGEAVKIASSKGIEKWPELRAFERRRDAVKKENQTVSYFQVTEPMANGMSRCGNHEVINFSSYDYLGLARDARVLAAAEVATKRWGTSANASRIAAGERPVHGELEAAIAKTLGVDSCLTLVGGYGTNVSVIGHLLGPGDLLLHDKLAHECILAGGRLSGAKLQAFKHNDVEDLEKQLDALRSGFRRVMIAVEGVYSMDGDVVLLPAMIRLKQRFDALLFVDEAHSFGVLGKTGKGVGEHYGIDRRDVDIWMGTLSKSLASCGGYLAGEKRLIEYLRYTLPGFVFSVGLPPAQAAAALRALQCLDAEPERVDRLREMSNALRSQFQAQAIDTGTSEDSAVVPWIVGDSSRAIRLAKALEQRGVMVHPIIAPAVDERAARLRFFVTAAHSLKQIEQTVAAVVEVSESVL